MNELIIKSKWNQLKASIKRNWCNLTDEDLNVDEGDARVLSGVIQLRYGITKEKADLEIREFGKIKIAKEANNE